MRFQETIKLTILCFFLGTVAHAQEESGKWYHILHFQATAGQTTWEESQWGFGAEHVSGIRWSPVFASGIGTGLNMLGYGDHKRVVPLFAELRIFPFPKARQQPFLVLDGGHSFGWVTNIEDNAQIRNVRGGMRAHLAAGMQWNTRSGASFVTEIGYLRQHTVLERNNFWWWGGVQENYIRESHRMQRWALRIGIGF